MSNELDKKVGTKEQPKLTPGNVIVQNVEVVTKGDTKKFKIVEFTVIHPDKDEPIKLSNLKLKKVQGNNETITKDRIWYREDSEGNIDMRCNAALLMKFYKHETLKSFINSSVVTELDNAGYLCIKAY